MSVKSIWTAALIGVVGFVPSLADAQILQSPRVENRTSTARQRAVIRQREAARQRVEAQQRVDARRRGAIFDRDIDGNRKRSCAHLSKLEKARCKELRKEEHRLAKLEKKRQRSGSYSVRDRTMDVIYGADVRRPRGTVPALETNRRLPRSGL